MTDFDPTQNRIQTMRLTDDELAALEAAIKANGGDPAPLTAEVVAMVAQLRQRAIFAKAENTGTAQGDAWHFDGAADMLTALATQIAEEQRIATERGNHIEFTLLPQMAALAAQLAERDAELALAVSSAALKSA